jgi:hypothetical protein
MGHKSAIGTYAAHFGQTASNLTEEGRAGQGKQPSSIMAWNPFMPMHSLLSKIRRMLAAEICPVLLSQMQQCLALTNIRFLSKQHHQSFVQPAQQSMQCHEESSLHDVLQKGAPELLPRLMSCISTVIMTYTT